MNLTEILSQPQLLPQISVADRWAVIETLIDSLVQTGKVAPVHRAAVCDAVKSREAKTSTGIGYGVALPHASTPLVGEVIAVAARLQPAVDFQSLDNQPVNFCVLFLTPQGEFQRHLQTLSSLARFLTNKDNRDKLASATSAEQMYAVLRGPA